MSASKSFTLIELLVVIAIIGVLASIVLISLSRARGMARYSLVLQQLKQIEMAARLDYEIYGDWAPDVYPGITPRFVPSILGAWPPPPCGNWTYDWENWFLGQNKFIRVTIRNTGDANSSTNSVFYYCIYTNSDCAVPSGINGGGGGDFSSVPGKSIQCNE